ncbi:helix-turn-helix domain-containing protein [Oceanobacillus massiliensis]|uniref:helix-turn-helix domain-containing protein n=1 Tax=Oceanobacillus massiliensis TaxID=1465765 RepID=UPI00028947F6|nr:helix-turn-helix transcriptional regulator [Oceanobacillus massiliensis]
MSDFLKLVGERIRIIRKAQGLTQEVLAEKAELQHSYIGGIERGERNISLLTLEKIINSLNISSASLFDFSDIDTANSTNINEILDIHVNLLRKRDIKDVKLIHKVAKEILAHVDDKTTRSL